MSIYICEFYLGETYKQYTLYPIVSDMCIHVDIYDIYVYACICTYVLAYILCTYMDLQEYKNACETCINM